MEFAKKEAEQLSQLEDALEKVHGQEQMYMEAIDNLQAEYDLLEQENMQLKKDATKKEETRQSLLKKINYDDIHVSATDLSGEPLGGYRTVDSRVSATGRLCEE
jgi:dynactin 1